MFLNDISAGGNSSHLYTQMKLSNLRLTKLTERLLGCKIPTRKYFSPFEDSWSPHIILSSNNNKMLHFYLEFYLPYPQIILL